jgi:molecular chaperone GrpE
MSAANTSRCSPAIGSSGRRASGYTRRAVSDENKTPDNSSPVDIPFDQERAVEPAQGDVQAPPDPLEAATAEVARLRDQLLRTSADFDNFRKRSRRELGDIERRAREDLLRELLPVFDNLERATAHAETATDVKALSDGIGLVMRQFLDTLAKAGIERIKTQGEAFDPAFHEAVQQFETSEQPPGTVMYEVQAGYRLGERLVRPAIVVVAKAPAN